MAVTVPRTTLAGLGAGATLAAALDPALREVTFFGLVRTDRDLPLRLSVPRTADTLYLELHDALGTSFRAQLPLPPETP